MAAVALMAAQTSILPHGMQAANPVKVENLKGRETVAVGQTNALRHQLWSQWKSKLRSEATQCLISTSTLDTTHVGRLYLPDSLEANAVMPYYW